MNSISVFAAGRIVGRVDGDTFKKSITGSRHFLRKPPAIAFDVSTLRDVEDAGALSVEVLDRETGRKYHAPISLVLAKGFFFNRGFGEQIGLSLRYFDVTGGNVTTTRAAEVMPARPAVQQLSLFGS